MKDPQNSTVRTLAIIPARSGSRSLPGKNIADLCGHPLIYYSIREAHASKRIDATIVSTDSEEVAAVARSLGADVPFLRPKELAGPDARDIGFLQHGLEWVRKERGWNPEAIIYLLPTTPSRTAADIDAAIDLLYRENADSVRTMVEAPHFNPYKMWLDAGNGGKVRPLFPEATMNIPRQEFKPFYSPVGAAYVTRAKFIEQGRVWGDDMRVSKFPLERFVEIDTPEDLMHAADVMQRFKLI
jgi:CMP-N-acetylneuraminic acid synthetase